jgi:lyso-ornithine lipid O-acyltransferase
MIQSLLPKVSGAAGLNTQKALTVARAGTNLARLSSLIARYAGEASWGKLRIKSRHERLGFFVNNVQKYSRRALETMNFELEVFGHDPFMMKERNFLLVCNHLSYIDILVTSSVQPAVFVTSVDMGQTPFLGPLAEMGGSIFVERRHRGRIGRDLGVMADTLRAGHHVMLYPEGTSSNGERMLPFKKSLLMSAVEAEVDILPMCIKYTEVDGEPFGPHNADRVCWYGDMSFAPHFLGLMNTKKVKAELHFLEPIPVTKESSRHELAEKAYQAISAVYHGNDEPMLGMTPTPSRQTQVRAADLSL